MAFSAVTERGSSNTKTSGTTLAVSPSADLTVGKIVWASCATDNTSIVNGATTDHTSVTDTHGHTWTKVFERTATPAGASADGVTNSLWFTLVTTQIGTGDSVTLTIATARDARTIGLFEATVGASQTVQVAASGAAFLESLATSNPNGVTLTGMASKEYLLIGINAREGPAGTWTEDADYTNVYSTESFGTTGGAAGTNASVNVGTRIATLTDDTFDVSAVSTTDHSTALVAFEEVAAGAAAQNLTGTLFTKAPTFPQGVLAPGAVTLAGTLFTKAPTFPTGALSHVVIPPPPTPSTGANRMGGTGAIRKPPRHR